MTTKIVSNKVRCIKCGCVIESKYPNDYKQCDCGTVIITGGHKRLFRNAPLDMYEELSVIEEVEEEPTASNRNRQFAMQAVPAV